MNLSIQNYDIKGGWKGTRGKVAMVLDVLKEREKPCP